jgi:hypothetical protein
MKLRWVLDAPNTVDVVCCVALRCVHVRKVCLRAVKRIALGIGSTCGLLHSIDLQKESEQLLRH